ncbi:MAG: hypothetical protein GX663_09275 [Clostridiales bacterium]|nr:hypothetical protein [Clostridiales bacterium]
MNDQLRIGAGKRMVAIMILIVMAIAVCSVPAYAGTSYSTVKTPRYWKKDVVLKTDNKIFTGKSLTLTYIPGKACQCDQDKKPVTKYQTRYMGYTMYIQGYIKNSKTNKYEWIKIPKRPYIRGDSKHKYDKITLKRNTTYKVSLYAVGGWNSSLPEKWSITPKLKFTFKNCSLK